MTTDAFGSTVHPDGAYGAVFERDCGTAYFYLIDMHEGGHRIVSALHVNAAEQNEAAALVRWAHTGIFAGLFIYGELLAVFDVDSMVANSGHFARLASPGDLLRFVTN